MEYVCFFTFIDALVEPKGFLGLNNMKDMELLLQKRGRLK